MFPFTLRQLEVFTTLCATGSFRATADHLGISQPAVSRQIRALETQLGYSLFTRRPGRRAELSAQGRRFSVETQQFLGAAKSLRGARRSPAAPPKPIRSYVGPHLLNDHVRPALPAFYAVNPGIVLDFGPDRPRSRVVADIKAGLLDFALFATRAPVDIPVKAIGTVGSGIYAAPGFKVSATDSASLSALPFVLPMPGSDEEAAVLDALAAEGIAPSNVVARSQFYEVRLSIAAHGKGVVYSLDSIVAAAARVRLSKICALSPWTRWLHVDPRIGSETAAALERLVLGCLESVALTGQIGSRTEAHSPISSCKRDALERKLGASPQTVVDEE